MTARISRRKLASYVVSEIERGISVTSALAEVAAYLVDSHRNREYELLVRDIEDVLAEHGTVVADVTTAHPLSITLRTEIITLLNAKNTELREIVDSNVIGGIRIDIPGQRYDGTIRRKLNALRAQKL
jgi:F0F1-type ATP synthase delta subunit